MTNTEKQTITIPKLIGTRGLAEVIVQDINETTKEVLVDFNANFSAAQGFCDELIKQLIQIRNLDVYVQGNSERVKYYLSTSSERRGLAKKLFFI